jgi:hypothetical protein
MAKLGGIDDVVVLMRMILLVESPKGVGAIHQEVSNFDKYYIGGDKLIYPKKD